MRARDAVGLPADGAGEPVRISTVDEINLNILASATSTIIARVTATPETWMSDIPGLRRANYRSEWARSACEDTDFRGSMPKVNGLRYGRLGGVGGDLPSNTVSRHLEKALSGLRNSR